MSKPQCILCDLNHELWSISKLRQPQFNLRLKPCKSALWWHLFHTYTNFKFASVVNTHFLLLFHLFLFSLCTLVFPPLLHSFLPKIGKPGVQRG